MIWLLETLALLLLHFPLLLGMGMSLESMCDGCDCGETPVCTAGICSNGGPIGSPTQYQVELSGFTNNSGTDCDLSQCENVDGTYSFTISGTCTAQITLDYPLKVRNDGGVCIDSIGRSLTLAFTSVVSAVLIVSGSGGVTDEYDYQYFDAGGINCETVSGLDLPTQGPDFPAPGCIEGTATLSAV